MEHTLREILESLSAWRQEMKKPNAEMKAVHAEMKSDIIAKIEACQKEILASFRGSTTCRTETTSCPGEMDATKTEATPEETEAAVEW
jgi:hypothetical protein